MKSNPQRYLSAFLAVVCTLLAGCGKDAETEKLKAEVERLKDVSERQSLKKEVEAINESTLRGSVFIVTKGGANFKLGLIPIVIAEPDQIRKHLDEKLNVLTGIAQTHKKSFESSSEALSEALKNLNSQIEPFDQAEAAYKSALTKLAHSAQVFESIHSANLKYGADTLQYQTVAGEFLKTLGNYKEAARKLVPYADKANAAYRTAVTERLEILSLIQGHMDTFFDDLPSLALLKTNADGEFHIKLPRRQTVVILGRGQRSVGKDIEKYYWMTEQTVPDKDEFTVLLSNDNLIDGVPGYTGRLYGNLPPAPNQPPDFSFDKAYATWSFQPHLPDPSRAKPATTPETKRNGNTLVLGFRASADVVDAKAGVLGVSALAPGTQIIILTEDEKYIYFDKGGKNLRLEKTKIGPPK